MRFHHLMVLVSDMDESLRLYRDVLGFEVAVEHVIPDPETLTTDSGVVLLNDYIHEAARKACFAADPMEPDDGTCVRKALASAKPQVAALVARAKAGANASANG